MGTLVGTWRTSGMRDAARIARVLGPGIAIVDSAATTASSLAEVLASRGLCRAPGPGHGRVTLLATDGAERFARVGAVFLGRPLAPADVEIVDLAPAPMATAAST